MKTPWSKLLGYGEGFAAFVVMCIASVFMFAGIAIAVLLSKLFTFIK